MTDKQTEALRLALEALECDPLDMALNPDGHMGFRKDQAITAIREALAEQPAQQELVALREVLPGRVCGYTPGMSRVELQLPEGTLIAGWLELGETVYIAPQPAQQEPVAFEIRAFNATQALIKRADVAQEKADVLERGFGSEADVTIVPLYTSQPAKKPWVGLTDKEWQEIDASLNGKRDLARIFVRAIEAKLREKNT